ncbi:MAG: type IV conjugative transfer system protein TraL [Nitrospinae bacterium]|nr:type IV conjugative transfer system protein TraL [Nitrospinota bacterium]
MKKVPVFRHLSQQAKILWLELDEFLLLGGFVLIGYVTQVLITMTVAGIIMIVIYMQVKKKFPRGFMAHAFVWVGFIGLKRYPNTFQTLYYE